MLKRRTREVHISWVVYNLENATQQLHAWPTTYQSVLYIHCCSAFLNTLKNFTHVIKIDKHTIHSVGHLLHRFILYSFSEQLFFWLNQGHFGLSNSSLHYQVFSVQILTDSIDPWPSHLFMLSQCFSHNSKIQWRKQLYSNSVRKQHRSFIKLWILAHIPSTHGWLKLSQESYSSEHHKTCLNLLSARSFKNKKLFQV